jgi:phage baseplate assembly protein W
MAVKKPARIYKDIDMGFSINPVTKDISRKYDVNAVKQAMKNLLFTDYYTKPFQPKYGSPLAEALFEPMDDNTANIIATLVQEAFDNWEPRVRIDDIIVYPDYDQNEYKVQLNFHVVGVRDPQIFTTALRRLR